MEPSPDSSNFAKAPEKSSAHLVGDCSAGRISLTPDPRWPYLNRWRTNSLSLSPMNRGTPTVENKAVLSSPASSELSSPGPDSGSPYTGRRSFKSTPPPSRIAKAASLVTAIPDGSTEDVASPKEKMEDALVTGLLEPSSGGNLEASSHQVPLPATAGLSKLAVSSVLQPRLGAWAKPIQFGTSASPISSFPVGEETGGHLSSSEQWPLLSQRGNVVKKKTLDEPTQLHKKNTTKEDDIRFPWAARMNPSSRNLFRASEPEYLEDGTPKVTIPNHVLLHGLEHQKEYILGQFFRCSPPPGGLIFAVFNKLWGRKGQVTIRKLGESSYLFHIPDKVTRTWVLQRGLWHVDDCLMFVAPWNPKASLAIPEIKTIPVWVTLKKIPNILYSIPGISNIASGLGAPMATYKPLLDPILMDEAKILVEVELSKAFPPRVAASDEAGFISMVDVEYAWIPSTCNRCKQLGHKVKYCLKSASEEDKVTSSVITASPASIPDQAKSTEVTPSEILVSDSNVNNSGDLTTSAPKPVLEEASIDIVSTTVLTSNNNLDSSESPPLETTQIVSNSVSPTTVVTVQSETTQIVSNSVSPTTVVTVQSESKQPELHLGNNKFASLVSSGGEEDFSDDVMDLMTPPGKRILRDRPVKPSVKAQESVWHAKRGGRGNRGRGRGGSG